MDDERLGRHSALDATRLAEQFLEQRASVSRELAIAAIEEAKARLVSQRRRRCWLMSVRQKR